MSFDASGVTGLAKRYAKALFELAKEQDQLDIVAAELNNLAQILADSSDLKKLVRSPIFTRVEQQRTISAVLAAIKASKLTQNFVGTLAKNGRLMFLSEMITAYRTVLAEHRGEITAQVVSAAELSNKQIKAIEVALNSVTVGKVSIQAVVDKDLIGGLLIRMGSQLIDSSLRTKLQRLSLAMKGVA